MESKAPFYIDYNKLGWRLCSDFIRLTKKGTVNLNVLMQKKIDVERILIQTLDAPNSIES